MFITLQYKLLKRLRPADPPYMNPTAYVGRSKLTTLCRDLLGDVTGKTVLDFGCGDGLEALELGQLGAAWVIGVDSNLGCVEIARWYANEAGVSDRIQFFQEMPTAQADVVISLDSFEHYQDPAGVLQMLYDALTPGGALVASFGPPWLHPYGGHLFSVYPWGHLLFSERALIRWREDLREDRPQNFAEAGLNRMTVKRFERLVQESPFRVEVFETVPIRRAARFYNRLTRELLTSVVRCRLRKPAGTGPDRSNPAH